MTRQATWLPAARALMPQVACSASPPSRYAILVAEVLGGVVGLGDALAAVARAGDAALVFAAQVGFGYLFGDGHAPVVRF